MCGSRAVGAVHVRLVRFTLDFKIYPLVEKRYDSLARVDIYLPYFALLYPTASVFI